MSGGHPYEVARRVLGELHKIFLEYGHQSWSIAPEPDEGEDGFRGTGIDEDAARKALRVLATKNLVKHVGQDSFVITDYGVSACDHPATLEHELPLPAISAPTGSTGPGAGSPAARSVASLDQYLPADLRARFIAVDHIGGGSYGTVFQIQDRESLQRFALKVTIAAPDAKARAEREASAMATLRHENVMTAIEFHPQGDWFIFPLAEGTLGQLQWWDRLTPSAPLTVAREIGSALAHAHAAGFIHRDLHVDNILRFDGAWRVADWGLTVARGNDRLTRTRSVGGIQTWTAPEQLKSLRNADERSDLYSLGRLVEWLATGRLPDGDRPGELPSDHPLAAFVKALTQLDPDKRPTNAVAALEMLPSGAPPFAPPPVSLARPATPVVVAPAALQAAHDRHLVRVEEVRERREQSLPLGDGPAVVVHLYPADESRNLELLPLKEGRFEPLPPVAHLHWQTRFNHDGLLAYWPDPPPASQRIQLFRNGAIELVDTYSVQRIRAPEPVLFPLNLERDIVNFVTHWTDTIYRPLGVAHPLVLCLSITGIKGFELHIDHRPSFKPKALFDRQTVSFRPVLLDGIADPRRLLKPTFDALWQAAGEDRSLGYSPAGEWLDSAHPQR